MTNLTVRDEVGGGGCEKLILVISCGSIYTCDEKSRALASQITLNNILTMIMSNK